MTTEERLDRLERAVLEIATLLDLVQWAGMPNPVKYGDGTAIAELRSDAERNDEPLMQIRHAEPPEDT